MCSASWKRRQHCRHESGSALVASSFPWRRAGLRCYRVVCSSGVRIQIRRLSRARRHARSESRKCVRVARYCCDDAARALGRVIVGDGGLRRFTAADDRAPEQAVSAGWEDFHPIDRGFGPPGPRFVRVAGVRHGGQGQRGIRDWCPLLLPRGCCTRLAIDLDSATDGHSCLSPSPYSREAAIPLTVLVAVNHLRERGVIADADQVVLPLTGAVLGEAARS